MKDVTIFGSSTAYYSPTPGMSYVDLLKKDYNVKSLCMRGYTIWHANYILPPHLTEIGKDKWIIIHVGASEAATMKIPTFLQLASYWLVYGSNDHFFQTFIAPKIYKASCDLVEGKDTFHSLLTSDEFKILYDRLLKALEGYSIICIGMSKPLINTSIPHKQALSFDIEIESMCKKIPEKANFIDIFTLCENETIDSNHLSDQGHQLVYNEIRRIIQ